MVRHGMEHPPDVDGALGSVARALALVEESGAAAGTLPSVVLRLTGHHDG